MRQKERTEKKSFIKEIKSWTITLVLIFGAVFLFLEFIGDRTTVQGPSMQPALMDGDNLIVDKISYRFFSPKRYDIVIFPFAYMEDTTFIKRIIALPGETVQIQDGKVYINGKKLDDRYASAPMKRGGIAAEGITLAKDEYFVLADNRGDVNSIDSRDPSVGCVMRDDLIGKALFRIWPVSRMGMIE